MGILIIIGKVLITTLIVILSLFLLALLLVGLVLFVPVRYKLVVEQEPVIEGEGQFVDKLHVKGLISWCLFLVRIPFSFDRGEGRYRIRILGIDIKKLKQKFPKRKKTKIRKKRRASGKKFNKLGKDTVSDKVTGKYKEMGDRETKDLKARNNKNTETNDIEVQEIAGKDKHSQNKGNDGESVKHKSLCQRIKGFFVGIFKMPAKIWKIVKIFIQKIKKFPSIIKEKKKKTKDFIELLKTDMVKESICVVWENVVHLWSKLKPGYLSGKLHFGTSDPCLTGQILGGIAVFMGMTGFYIEVTPDFCEKVFEGRIEIKGRLQFVTLLKIIVRLYLDENIKKVAKQFNLF